MKQRKVFIIFITIIIIGTVLSGFTDADMFSDNYELRKADGTQVLLCGADEGETGWEWVESTPLPQGTRFGDENSCGIR